MEKQPAQQRPLLLWLILWFLINPILYIRNAINLGEGNIGGLIMSAVIGLGIILFSLVLWFVIKWLYGLVTGGGKIMVKQAFIIWLVFFLIIFFIPMLRG